MHLAGWSGPAQMGKGNHQRGGREAREAMMNGGPKEAAQRYVTPSVPASQRGRTATIGKTCVTPIGRRRVKIANEFLVVLSG
jgi:hypothetical protein